MPAPAAYIVPTKEPNAFSWARSDRVVAVTQGLVDLLDRRELEAVVAHGEVGHLKHGDTGRAAQAAAVLGASRPRNAGATAW